jgi:hypothetical protein
MGRLRRFGLIVAMAHLSLTLLIGYIVLPLFHTMREPPPPPPPYAPVVFALADVLYFPLVSLVQRLLVTDWAQPGLSYVLANSALVSALVTLAYALLRRTRHAVA